MEARAWPTGAPMALPPLARLLGGTPESVEQFLNYGYRAAWKVRLGNDLFAVKADARAGFQQGEVDAHRHAATSGIPVPEIVGVDDGPPATVAIGWVDGVSLHGQDSAGAWRAAGRTLRLIHGQSTLRPREQPWDESSSIGSPATCLTSAGAGSPMAKSPRR